jgi:hypothetical protein
VAVTAWQFDEYDSHRLHAPPFLLNRQSSQAQRRAAQIVREQISRAKCGPLILMSANLCLLFARTRIVSHHLHVFRLMFFSPNIPICTTWLALTDQRLVIT